MSQHQQLPPALPPPVRRFKPFRRINHNWIPFGLIMCVYGLVPLLSESDIIDDLRPYFWKTTEGTVISSDISHHYMCGRGDVTFKVTLKDKMLEITKTASRCWSSETASDRHFPAWADSYAPGKTIAVYYHDDGWTAINRGIDGRKLYNLMEALMFLSIGVGLILFSIYKMRSQRYVN